MQGHEGRFSIYIHASKEKPVHVSRYFVGREIHSEQLGWGSFAMVEAERRLLANALLDLDNQHFVLLSERYIEHMLPEVEKKDFRKGSQSIDESPHITSDAKRTVLITPCMWKGSKRPCYLFARKFYPETLDKLMRLFSNSAAF